MPQVPDRLMGRIIVVTVQQTCHFDIITKGDFSSAGPWQLRLTTDQLKRMTDICWIIREIKRKKLQVFSSSINANSHSSIHLCLQSETT